MDQLDAVVRPSTAAWIIGGCAFFVLILAQPLKAAAHAFPKGAQPRVGATVNSPPAEVLINFDNPIEQLFAKLQVLDSSDQDETAGPVKVSADHKQLSVPVKPLKPGDYTVKWGVVAEDGHHTEGWYQFTVAGGSGS